MILSPSIIRKMPLAQKWAGVSGASSALTPPTVAPVLTNDPIDPGSFITTLNWTASDKTDSAGFGYRVYMQYDAGGYNDIETNTNLTTYFDADPNAGVYDFRIVPFNDAGEGPSSNTVSVTVPGESEAPDGAYLTNDGAAFFTTPAGDAYYRQPE